VNRHLEIISKGKTETGGRDVAVAGDVGRDPHFIRPGGAAVGGTAVISVPVGSGTSIHPGDAHVASGAGHNGRKSVFHTKACGGDILPGRPGSCASGGRCEVDTLGLAGLPPAIPERVKCAGGVGTESHLRAQESPATLVVRATGRRG